MATEQSIIEGLIRDYGEPHFLDRDFHGYRAATRNTRMFFSMRILEDQITNGGLAQLLWNVFFHWRIIVEDCSFAYAAIGAEPQAVGMSEVTRLLAVHESACGAYVERAIATKNFAEFQSWYAVGEPAMDSPVEPLFYYSDILDTLKQSWISSHATGTT